MEEEILINTLYTGDYTNKNIGHEIINLYQTDKGERYLYITPYGAIGKEHYDKIKYVLLVREGKDRSTEIIAKAEVESLPPECYPEKSLSAYKIWDEVRKTNKTNKNAENYKKCHEAQLDYIKDETIYYGGVRLDKIISDNAWKDYSIYLTFKIKKIEKPTRPIYFYKKTDNTDKKYIIQDTQDNEKFCIYNSQIRNSSMMRFITQKPDEKELYDFINNHIISQKDLWIECAMDDNSIKEIDTYKRSFLNIIHKENDELVFSNMFKYFFDEKPEVFEGFLKFIYKKEDECPKISNRENYEIKREEENIDLLITLGKNVFVIENKIKSGINGIKHDPYTGRYTTQLNKYHEWIEKEVKKEDSDYFGMKPHFYIFHPNYNKIDKEKLKNMVVKESKKQQLDDYNFVSYRTIFDFFNRDEIKEIYKTDEVYFNEFLQALKKHIDDTDMTIEHEMDAKFKDAILKAIKLKNNN